MIERDSVPPRIPARSAVSEASGRAVLTPQVRVSVRAVAPRSLPECRFSRVIGVSELSGYRFFGDHCEPRILDQDQRQETSVIPVGLEGNYYENTWRQKRKFVSAI